MGPEVAGWMDLMGLMGLDGVKLRAWELELGFNETCINAPVLAKAASKNLACKLSETKNSFRCRVASYSYTTILGWGTSIT